MTDRILVLHEGNPAKGVRGGDVYWQHLFRELGKDTELVHVNRDVLGLTGTLTGAQYSHALERYLGNISWRAPVLHDGSSFYLMSESNRMLRRNGWGPIISFMQEWWPARQQSFRMRAHMNRYMFRFLHSVDAHITVSEWLRMRIMRLGVSGKRISVARPGVPDACFASAARPQRKSTTELRIVSAGVYHPSKGQLLLVEAIGELKARIPEFVRRIQVNMYGGVDSASPEYFERVKRRVSELGLEQTVHLHGHISQAQLFEAFADSHVFSFTASGEGLALVVLESMMHRCVPVVSRDSAMMELLNDGRFGMSVDQTPKALARAIEEIHGHLKSDSRWPDQVAAGARAQALTWEVAARECAERIRERITAR